MSIITDAYEMAMTCNDSGNIRLIAIVNNQKVHLGDFWNNEPLPYACARDFVGEDLESAKAWIAKCAIHGDSTIKFVTVENDDTDFVF